MVPGDLLDMGKTTQRGTPDRRAIKSEANCLANDGAISRGRVTSRTVPACGRGYILGYPYSFAASVSQLAVRSLGADDCASQTRHREQFGTYDEGAHCPEVRPAALFHGFRLGLPRATCFAGRPRDSGPAKVRC